MSIDFTENIKAAVDNLHKRGAFLTAKDGDKVNTMTIGWGAIGYQWNRPIFTVLVRESRYTYELIEKASEFTVSIPLNDDLKAALAFCGSKSGRDYDKIKECNLTLEPGKTTSTPIIGDCGLQFECKIVYKEAMNPELLSAEVKNASYKNGDYHTTYYGEIVGCYIK